MDAKADEPTVYWLHRFKFHSPSNNQFLKIGMLFFSNEYIPKQIMCTLNILKNQIMFLLNCGVFYLKDAEDSFFCEIAFFLSPLVSSFISSNSWNAEIEMNGLESTRKCIYLFIYLFGLNIVFKDV